MTLEERRRYDLIEMFKIIKGIDKDGLFEVNTNRTRGHSVKIIKNPCRLRKNFFMQRIVNDWDQQSAIDQKTVLL